MYEATNHPLRKVCAFAIPVVSISKVGSEFLWFCLSFREVLSSPKIYRLVYHRPFLLQIRI